VANDAAGAAIFYRGAAAWPQAWIDFVGPDGKIFGNRDQGHGGLFIFSGRR
jgi:hypothetical protein